MAHEHVDRAAIRAMSEVVSLPSIRRLVLPDPGYTIVDADLKRADAHIVAWEANEPELKHIFQNDIDIYVEEAKWVYGASSSLPFSEQRQNMKNVVHAANYGGKARTLGSTAGVITATMEKWLTTRWYGRFPGVLRWHKATLRQLKYERQVRNVWGFRRFYFDEKIESVLPQALAWIGQSSVAITINKAMLAVRQIPHVRLLLQVHDNLVLQVPTAHEQLCVEQIKSAMNVPLPYVDPLTIPITIKSSDKSWGDIH